jgi:hypothetical protein
MTRHAPRLALALLEHIVPDGASLAGDLLEEFGRRPSRRWLWWQVLGAIVTARFQRPDEIRPLRLVDVQPADAWQRSRRATSLFRPVSLSASPLSDVGGLGIVVLVCLLTTVMPAAWWVLLLSMFGGALLGLAIIATRRKWRGPVTTMHLR